ncbi:MAG: CBS domain-containing protein [Candidatus Omnitrophota bacterium]
MANRSKPKLDDLTNVLRLIKAKDIMTKHVITTTEDASLADIAELMMKMRISGMPVVAKNGSIRGVVTLEDLFVVMDMIESGDIVENGVSAAVSPTAAFAMSAEVVTVKENTTLNEIIAIMKNKSVHTLPVLRKGKMVGVIGRRDVFKNFYAVVKDLYE